MQKLRQILLSFLIVAAAWANFAAAATVRIDYGYDTNNFFGVGTQARAAMDAAASFYSGILQDTLSAIQTPADFHGSLGGTANVAMAANLQSSIDRLRKSRGECFDRGE